MNRLLAGLGLRCADLHQVTMWVIHTGNGVAREGDGVAKQTPLRRLAPLFGGRFRSHLFSSNLFSVGERAG
jgi:hypothetical protein